MKITIATILIGLALCATAAAQDKAAVVASFKQEIRELLNTTNLSKGIEQATVASSEAKPSEPPAVHAKRKMVHKDGTPCGAFHNGWCHDVWVDDAGVVFTDGMGKSCDPAQRSNTCRISWEPKPKQFVWIKGYNETVSDYGFDVKVTDSLVTPYIGTLSYTVVFRFTAEHPTKEEAEKDNHFISSLPTPLTFTYGYQDEKWVLLPLPK